MTDSYNVGYSVDALGDFILRMNFLFRRQPQLSWGAYERKFVHWILCQLVIR